MPRWIWTLLGVILLVWLLRMLLGISGTVLAVLLVIAAIALVIGYVMCRRAA